MSIWQAAITVARRDTSYLNGTLISLASAGWNDPWLFHDRGSSVIGTPAYREYASDAHLGPHFNFRRALDTLVRESDAKFFVLFQDDIRVTWNLRAWLERDPFIANRAKKGVFSLYCAAATERFRVGKRWGWFALAHIVHGACGYLFHRQVAEKFIGHKFFNAGRTRTEHWVQKWCREVGKIPYFVHAPSFVQHCGEVSAINGKYEELNEARRASPFLVGIEL